MSILMSRMKFQKIIFFAQNDLKNKENEINQTFPFFAGLLEIDMDGVNFSQITKLVSSEDSFHKRCEKRRPKIELKTNFSKEHRKIIWFVFCVSFYAIFL
jgi:hypothetical protein